MTKVTQTSCRRMLKESIISFLSKKGISWNVEKYHEILDQFKSKQGNSKVKEVTTSLKQLRRQKTAHRGLYPRQQISDQPGIKFFFLTPEQQSR